MSRLRVSKLPRSVGELIHLRYLDLSMNEIKKLPDSITQLVNLYLLDLSYCWKLEELPNDISKLVMLRHLSLYGCDNLSYIPKGLQRLRGLETLGYFVVGKARKSLSLGGSKSDMACDLADLRSFDNLKGTLTIILDYRSKDTVSEAMAANLDMKEKITVFTMSFREGTEEDEMVLENLKPCANLSCLHIEKYGGTRLPSWMREGIHVWLPNLVEVRISECKACIYLCSFGRLPNLKQLDLECLYKVEYIENTCSSNDDNTIVLMNEHLSTPLFPALEYLSLIKMPALKRWRGVTDSAQDQGQNQLLKWMQAFPKLVRVRMGMELVTSFAEVFQQMFKSLGYLIVTDRHIVREEQTFSYVSVRQRQPLILLKNYTPMLHSLHFRCNQIEILPEEFRDMTSLRSLRIADCEDLEAIPEWIDSLTSLRSLVIESCPKLKSLPQQISNLPNLFSLDISDCTRELAERCQTPTGEDWSKIQHIPNICITPVNDDES